MGLVAVFRSRVPGAWSARNETRDARRKKACVAPRGQTAQSAAPCGAIPAARGSDPDFASVHPGCRATRLARVFPFHDVKRAQSSSFPPHPASAVAQRIGKRRVLAFPVTTAEEGRLRTFVVQKRSRCATFLRVAETKARNQPAKKRPTRSARANNHEIEGCHLGVIRIGWRRRRQKTGAG